MKKLFAILAILVASAALYGYSFYHSMTKPAVTAGEEQQLFIYPSEPTSAVVAQLGDSLHLDVRGLRRYLWLQRTVRHRTMSFKPGHYVVREGDDMRSLALRFASGAQTPVRLVVPDGRDLGRIVARIADQLMADSSSLMQALPPKEQAFTLFVPNTYEVYWTLTPKLFVERMIHEHDVYWNDSRRALAARLGLTPDEVVALASIVDEETAKNDEKPVVARLYLNRLAIGMRLQADPTVKYAVGDPTLRRIFFVHLETPSPYNTYLHEGLPPSPIRLPSLQAVEAVLHPADHDWLYMCAREDFSGYHNFARSLADHNANARRYQAALNAKGIH